MFSLQHHSFLFFLSSGAFGVINQRGYRLRSPFGIKFHAKTAIFLLICYHFLRNKARAFLYAYFSLYGFRTKASNFHPMPSPFAMFFCGIYLNNGEKSDMLEVDTKHVCKGVVVMDRKKHIIGLDIGTTSVGWAVMDEDFNLVQGKKKIVEIDVAGNVHKRQSRTNLWGVRLFDAAAVAADRRLKRGGRRRLARRKKRLEYLRCIFRQEILAFDDSFFIRMDESFYQNDDDIKTVKVEYPLFNGKKWPGITDTFDNEIEYYDKYPTIYHLRKRLIEDNSQADLRLIYLAMHHILKFRGHFTNQGQKFDLKNIDVAESLLELLHQYEMVRQDSFEFNFDDAKHDEANAILIDRKKSKSWKAFNLTQLFSVLNMDEYFSKYDQEGMGKKTEKFLQNVDGQLKALFTAIVGNSIDVAKIFGKDEYKPSDDNKFVKGGEFKYANENFEEKLAEIESEVTPEEFEVLISGKKVYESVALSNILTAETLASSMVLKYDLHKEQLARLKKFTKSVSYELFEKFFKEDGIYSKFIQGVGNPAKTISREDFYKEIKKAFESEFSGLKFPDAEKEFDFSKADLVEEQEIFLESINEAMRFETYLPKQRMSDNGAIPYQVHEHELIEIIKKQSVYYSFLEGLVETEIEQEDGTFEKVTEYQIQTLFKFRIPYYVGTLATKRDEKGQFVYAKNAWVARKSDDELTPWNFNDVIDKEKSAINFIERMTNFCTYLPSEKVLPDKSLLYQEFKVYNELISSGYYQDGKKCYFSSELRQKIVERLFKENKRVSAKKLIEFLNAELRLNLEHPRQLFGIDTAVKTPGFNNSFSTYKDLIDAGVKSEQINDYRDRFETIIKWQTIFEDKKILKKTITNANEYEWNGFLTGEQVNKLVKKHYTGWGRLSRKLLNGIKANNGKTIIQNLKEEKFNNFMRLLEDEAIAEAIKEAQIEGMEDGQISYNMVADLTGSPALKKGIWQSLKIIKELESYLGKENISKIVVEMAREHSTGRTQTRQKQIENFYNKFKEKTEKELDRNLHDEFKSITDAKNFDNEKLFLYFLQNGKCMYSGNSLNLSHLSEYEVDHIIPQTYIKDDSFDNKALVLRKENQNKGSGVPHEVIVRRMSSFWEILEKSGQVSPKKLKNLKMKRISEGDMESFINRQLVETRQITKHVANILSEHFKETDVEVLTPKSGLTSQFRQGIVYVDKQEFDFESAIASRLYFEDNNKVYLPSGEIIQGKYSNSNFVKVHFHEGFKKNRDLNDYHHAHDAYLNAIVANYIYATRPDLRKAWVYGQYKRNLSRETGNFGKQRQDWHKQLLTGMAEESWIFWDDKTGEVSQEFKRDEILDKIKRYLGFRNVNVVRKIESAKGAFSKEGNLKKGSGSLVRKNNLSLERYGGSNADATNIAFAIRDKKGKIKINSIPLVKKDMIKRNADNFVVKTYQLYKTEAGYYRYLTAPKEAQKATQYTSAVELSQLLEFAVSNSLIPENKISERTFEKFEKLESKDKEEVLKNALKLVRRGTSRGLNAFKLINLPADIRYTTSKDIISNGSTLISQSTTGLFETRRKL